MSESRFIAIIPAAGHSRRMGQPKLLLPWRGTSVIGHLVRELRAAGITLIYVVLRASDDPLKSAVEASGAIPIQPAIDPPDMRTSVEYGVKAAQQAGCFTAHESGWFLIPADHPIVTRDTIKSLLDAWCEGPGAILIPTHNGQRGHPTLLSRDLASEVAAIPADCGLNWLIRRHAATIREVPVPDPGVIADLDTPQDYQALLNRDHLTR